eukprot:gb/GEZN01006239.1/.p1 GENE.gb/GEZN01006239.1/~~gb/GEZN01006239.1/.p1  ORF type:complete len:370 (+),score=58.70 gb/GEZN01006239.1/:373-1482(+)
MRKNPVYELLKDVTLQQFTLDVQKNKAADREARMEEHRRAVDRQKAVLRALEDKTYSSVVERKKVLDETDRELQELVAALPSWSPSSIVTATDSDTIETCIEKLNDNNILSVPVLSSDSEAKHSTMGFIDMIDVVYFMGKTEAKGGKDVDIKTATVKEVLAFNKKKPVDLMQDTKLPELLEIFASGSRRCSVLKKEGGLVGIVSQGDTIRYLHDHLYNPKGVLLALGNKTVTELGNALKPVATVTKKSTVREALMKMVENGVFALAVVDDTGKLVGNFSASDFRYINHTHFKQFKLKTWRIDTFLGTVHTQSLKPITLQATARLGDAVHLLVTSKLHHLWICDDKGIPIGIVSMTDIHRMVTSIDSIIG